MTLYEHLSKFERYSSEEELTNAFLELAPHFIYGGYIKVSDIYRIYIRTVEFYYHDESEKSDAIKDPIMYHRNGNYEGTIILPYFPLMSLNAHESGYDITFENEEQCYRASALIREYSIYDCRFKNFILLKNGKIRDDRVTYLYEYLNGFSLNGKSNILWIDDEYEQKKPLLQGSRIRTVVIKDGKKTLEPDTRQWRFKLNEDIWLPTD